MFKISGMLYRGFSKIDLEEMNQIAHAIDMRQNVKYICPETILCNFEGHSIFSLFFDRVEVYE